MIVKQSNQCLVYKKKKYQKEQTNEKSFTVHCRCFSTQMTICHHMLISTLGPDSRCCCEIDQDVPEIQVLKQKLHRNSCLLLYISTYTKIEWYCFWRLVLLSYYYYLKKRGPQSVPVCFLEYKDNWEPLVLWKPDSWSLRLHWMTCPVSSLQQDRAATF